MKIAPMKIVIVGNYNEKKAGANFYATVRKLTNGFTRNGHHVMPFSDRDVAREESGWGIGRAGGRGANRRLIELVGNFRPDLLILFHADKIANDTIREIRASRPDMPVAVINLDPLFLPENPPRIRRFAEVADVTFVTTAGARLQEFATLRHRVAFIPNPVDPSVESLECFAREDQASDLICTIGSEQGTPWRGEFMRALRDKVPECRYAYYGLDEQPSVFGGAYFDAIGNARMGLNLSRADDHYLYSSDRFAQYAGNGLLTFVARETGYDDIFTDEEFVFYRDMEDLADRLRFFLAHDGDRQRVARNGHARYHALFNERLVARFVEQVAVSGEAEDGFAWPTTVHSG